MAAVARRPWRRWSSSTNERDPSVDWVNPQRHPQALLTITDFDGGFVFRDVPATTY